MTATIPAVIVTALHVDGGSEEPAGYGRRIWTHPSGATCRIGRGGRIDVWTHPSRDATFAPGACPVGAAATVTFVMVVHAVVRRIGRAIDEAQR